jgi:hypothetical protein
MDNETKVLLSNFIFKGEVYEKVFLSVRSACVRCFGVRSREIHDSAVFEHSLGIVADVCGQRRQTAFLFDECFRHVANLDG